MPVPTTITDLNVAAASNSPAGGDQVGPSLDDYLRATQAILRRTNAKGSNLASSSTVSIGGSTDGDFIHITGTTTITSFGTVAAGVIRIVTFDGILTVTHSSNILIGQSVTTKAGDMMALISEGGGVWRCLYRTPNMTMAVSGTNTYTSAGELATDKNIILVDFANQNTSATCTLNGVAIRTYTGVSGMNAAIGSLRGIQRLQYNSSNTCWIALDVRDLDFSSYSGSNVEIPIGYSVRHTFSSGTLYNTRLTMTARSSYQISGYVDITGASVLGVVGTAGASANLCDIGGYYAGMDVAPSGVTINTKASSLMVGSSFDIGSFIVTINTTSSKTTGVVQGAHYSGTGWYNIQQSLHINSVLDLIQFASLSAINATSLGGAFQSSDVVIRRIK